MKKQYKIVKIPDDKTLVINAGVQDGVKVGDRFRIVGGGEDVYDPDTKELLGTLGTTKATVSVVDVQERLCVCQDTSMSVFSSAVTAGLAKSFPKTMNIDPDSLSTSSNAEDEMIRVGDKAVHISQK